LGEDARKISGIADASVKIIPYSGYGDANILRELIMRHQPDAILHFTDPRYWRWLYEMEAEVRQNVPIFFYHIWDDLPDPQYNRDYYESCDWLGCISKQTYGIVKRVGQRDDKVTFKPLEDWQVSYVPHGIDSEKYKPTEVPVEFRKAILGDKDYKFILFWMNRNIRRKQPSDVIWAYKRFVDGLPEEDRSKVLLLMHTAPIDQNGTDLFAVKETICPDYDVRFSQSRISQQELNYLYNLSDVTINIAGNEGFGLVTAESVMAGTPIIVNVTGGLQDQCGFTLDGKELTAEDYVKIGSLHDVREWADKVKHGDWVKPVFSKVQTLVGSVPTPYIIDDKVDIYEVADALRYWYDTPIEERKQRGLNGRTWMLKEDGLNTKYMCKTLIDGMETAMENWKPKERYNLYKIA
jgi:glycosyltransferase involved in cell wall biosynthesis